MASFQGRVIGALTLNVATYEEVERDTSATAQAAGVVVLAAISSGIGWIWYGGLSGIVSGAVVALVAWVVGAVVVWLIGTKVLPGPRTEADITQVMRCVGFAQAPGLLAFISIIPVIGWLITFALWIWGLVAWVIAVRQALDYDDTMRAVIVCLLAWVAIVLVTLTGAAIFGLSAATANSMM